MKKIVLFLFSIFSVYLNTSLAQIGIGEWRMHISPNDGLGIVKSNASVHIALSRGLLSYDLNGGEKTIRTAADYLSDVNLTAIGYFQPKDATIIGYRNGNIDILIGETIFNMPAIVQSSVSGVRQINAIKSDEQYTYLATGFGVVVIDVDKREVRDTYYPTGGMEEVVDVSFFSDSIFVLTPTRLFAGALSNDFLADPGQWEEKNYVPDYSETGRFIGMEVFENKLVIGYNDELYNGDTVFVFEDQVKSTLRDGIEVNGLRSEDEELHILSEGSLFTYDINLDQSELIFQYTFSSFPRPIDVVKNNGLYYIADKDFGLVSAPDAFSSNRISFEGPAFSSSFRADWQRGKLAVAGGGLSGNNPAFINDGGYVFEEEEWNSVRKGNQSILEDVGIWDFISVAVNRRNTDQVAFGTYAQMPLVMMKDGATITDTFGFSNSLIEPTLLGNGWGHISDMQFDNSDNLWVLNAYSDRPLKVKTEEDLWYDFDLGSFVRNKLTRRIVIDNDGIKWFGVDGAGVIAFDDNQTIDDPTDDRRKILTTSENAGALPSATVEAIAVDVENNIWVGTVEGLRVLYNSRNVFDGAPGSFDFQRLLIEFGENVEIVLGTTHITSIEIDGANRKWIGTANSGVFLFSADGLTLVRNFTAENSPLLSNTILDIAINQDNGEVFFVTDDGLISYRSDASQGDPNYNQVSVFPNPVLPTYFGPITIQGIAANSDVRITDVSGKLVFQTQSNGGTATWDGRTLDGNRVTTGVYLIWTAVNLENGKGREVGKVVFVN